MQHIAAVACEIPHVVLPASGMGRHEVVGQVEVPAASRDRVREHGTELLEYLPLGLTHEPQNARAHMLGCDLHLTGDVMGDDPVKVLAAVGPVGDYHVVPDAGVHEDVPHAGHLGDPAQQVRLPGVVDGKMGTGSGPEASAIRAHP